MTDAKEIVARLRHQNAEHDFDAHEAAADLIEQQAKRIASVRAATIEDCAKVADEILADPKEGGRGIAKAIRALADKEQEVWQPSEIALRLAAQPRPPDSFDSIYLANETITFLDDKITISNARGPGTVTLAKLADKELK